MKKIISIFVSCLVVVSLLFPVVSMATVSVKGYYRKNGTYVAPHTRTDPNGTKTDNYSYPGNYNPNTGKITGGTPTPSPAPILYLPSPAPTPIISTPTDSTLPKSVCSKSLIYPTLYFNGNFYFSDITCINRVNPNVYLNNPQVLPSPVSVPQYTPPKPLTIAELKQQIALLQAQLLFLQSQGIGN